jgi:hypothetical protein
MKILITTISMIILSSLGWSQSFTVIAYKPKNHSEVDSIIKVADFYGYRIENNCIKESGISEYRTQIPTFMISNYQTNLNKKIEMTYKIYKEKNDIWINIEYYNFTEFIRIISYDL